MYPGNTCRFTIGGHASGSVCAKGCTGVADTGIPLITGPPDEIDVFMRHLGASQLKSGMVSKLHSVNLVYSLHVPAPVHSGL